MSAKMKNIFASLALVHGSLFDKGQSDCVEKSAAENLLHNNNNNNNDDDGSCGTANDHLTSSNIGVLLDELDRRSDGTLIVASLDSKVTSNKKEQLKKHLRSCDGQNDYVPWHLYGDADLWTALKRNLRHLPTCPLGSNFYQEWSRVQWDYSDKDRLESIRVLLKMLSHSDRSLVRNLFRILHKISRRYPTESDSSTLVLAAKLGPYLVWDFGDAPRHSSSKRIHFQTLWLVAYIIDHFTEIFSA